MAEQPDRCETLPNGAVIAFDSLVRKWLVLDGSGVEHGYRYTAERARAFAMTLPAATPAAQEPAPISRSPRALPLPPDQLDQHGHRPSAGERGERVSRPVVTVTQAYGRAKSMTRRHQTRG